MLELIRSDVTQSETEIRKQHPFCKFIFIVDKYGNTDGKLYAVSHNNATSHELYEMADELAESGIKCTVKGEYDEGEMAGVQFVAE